MKINFLNSEKKNIEVNIPQFDGDHVDLVTRFMRVFSLNQRHGTSKVKTRSEVSGGGKKPWKQKGTGRARAGSSRSPLWVGGGRAKGPTPKNWDFSLNKKMKENALVSSLNLKEKDSKVMAIDTDSQKISTKEAKMSLKDLNNAKILLISTKADVYKAYRNIFGVSVVNVNELNAAQVVSSDTILIASDAVKPLEERVNN